MGSCFLQLLRCCQLALCALTLQRGAFPFHVLDIAFWHKVQCQSMPCLLALMMVTPAPWPHPPLGLLPNLLGFLLTMHWAPLTVVCLCVTVQSLPCTFSLLFCRFIPGGSSSGSGVAVGSGLVSFALGTDTAGSGDSSHGLCHESCHIT